ncbi:MAG: response regulator transcription factor [Lachnospiraceae bacterium]|nr:response regulator transcription factor [Lachnospiraceae bacterium]
MGTEYSLKSEGMEVCRVRSVQEVKRRWMELSEKMDCILLDVMLPDGDGYQLLDWLSERGNTIPVIFLSALSDEGNVVRGLNQGGADYVTKPFRMKELIARIHANIRSSTNGKKQTTILAAGPLQLDLERFITRKGDRQIELTPGEFRLLAEFMRHPGVCITRQQLMSLWSADEIFMDDNTLSVYIRRLREKIDGEKGSYIQTIRGVGYRFQMSLEEK